MKFWKEINGVHSLKIPFLKKKNKISKFKVELARALRNLIKYKTLCTTEKGVYNLVKTTKT